MAVISKPLFYETIGDHMKCDVIHKLGQGCVESNLIVAVKSFLGSLKFFLPIYIIKAIMNHKKLKERHFLRNLVIEEIRSAVYGVTMAQLFLGSVCMLCKLTGRIHYYNIALLPGMISGLSVLVETKANRTLDTLIFVNLLIDSTLKNMDYFNYFKLTVTKETVLFMIVSGLLMHNLQNRTKNTEYTNFWFYTPHKFKEENDVTIKNRLDDVTIKNKLEHCDHKQSCTEFTFKGARKFFLLGYSFSILRKLIPKMLAISRKPKELLRILVNRDNVKFGMFIGAYVAIYRYVMCFLLKSGSVKKRYSGAIAGLVSGTTYLICPNLQVLTVGITTLCQVYYHYILQSFKVRNQFIPELMVYIFSHGLLMHNAILCKRTCPPYYINMLNTCSNNVFRDIYGAIILKYFG